MAWIWSDDLAAAAEAAGLVHSEIAVWRRQPVAFALRPEQAAADLARALLGLGTGRDRMDHGTRDGEGEVLPGVCTCGEVESRDAILAPRAAAG